MSSKVDAGIQAALLNARQSYEAIQKNAQNPFTSSSYATLDNVLQCVKNALISNNINHVQRVDLLEGRPVLRTELTHVPSGETLESVYPLPESNNPQQFGAAITYARRYSLPPMLGVATESDDDGESAKPQSQKPANKLPQKPSSKPIEQSETGEIEMGQEGYDTLLTRLKKLCEALGETDVLDRFVEECGVSFNTHYSDTKSPRPFLLKSFFMQHNVKFDKSTNTASGLTKSKYDQVNALFDAIEIGLSEEGFEK